MIPQRTASKNQRPLVVRLLPELDFGGVEARARLQAQHFDRSAYNLRLCTFHKPGAAAQAIRACDVDVDVLGESPRVRNPRATLALAKYLRRLRPDVIHASIVEANVHAMLARPLAARAALVVEEVGMPSHGRLTALVLKALYRSPDALIGVTQATCDYMVNVDGAPRHRVRRVFNCAGLEHFPDPPRKPGGRGDSDRFVVLAVGRLVPVKNHSVLLEAVARMRHDVPGIELVLAGDGPLGEELRQRADALGVRACVSFLGYKQDVRALLARAHVYALPSHSEGCSISLIEAMAAGVPIVASRVAGNAEVMGPLADEWTVEASDVAGWVSCLNRQMALAPEARACLGRQYQTRAYEHFSPRAYLGTLERLYLELAR